MVEEKVRGPGISIWAESLWMIDKQLIFAAPSFPCSIELLVIKHPAVTLLLCQREREAKKRPTWLTLNFNFTIK